MVTNSSKHSPEERNEEFLHPPALTEICSWPALEEAQAISTPRVPWCGQDTLDLLLTLKEGAQHSFCNRLYLIHRT